MVSISGSILPLPHVVQKGVDQEEFKQSEEFVLLVFSSKSHFVSLTLLRNKTWLSASLQQLVVFPPSRHEAEGNLWCLYGGLWGFLSSAEKTTARKSLTRTRIWIILSELNMLHNLCPNCHSPDDFIHQLIVWISPQQFQLTFQNIPIKIQQANFITISFFSFFLCWVWSSLNLLTIKKYIKYQQVSFNPNLKVVPTKSYHNNLVIP